MRYPFSWWPNPMNKFAVDRDIYMIKEACTQMSFISGINPEKPPNSIESEYKSKHVATSPSNLLQTAAPFLSKIRTPQTNAAPPPKLESRNYFVPRFDHPTRFILILPPFLPSLWGHHFRALFGGGAFNKTLPEWLCIQHSGRWAVTPSRRKLQWPSDSVTKCVTSLDWV